MHKNILFTYIYLSNVCGGTQNIFSGGGYRLRQVGNVFPTFAMPGIFFLMPRNGPRRQRKPGERDFPRFLHPGGQPITGNTGGIHQSALPAMFPYLEYPVALFCRVPAHQGVRKPGSKILPPRASEKPVSKIMRICKKISKILKKVNKDYCPGHPDRRHSHSGGSIRSMISIMEPSGLNYPQLSNSFAPNSPSSHLPSLVPPPSMMPVSMVPMLSPPRIRLTSFDRPVHRPYRTCISPRHLRFVPMRSLRCRGCRLQLLPFSAFRRSGKKGLVANFTDDSDSSDPGDPNVGYDPEDDYEVISLRGFRTLENELKRALDELNLREGEV